MDALIRIELAVRALIVGKGSIRERLHHVYGEHLAHVKPGAVPAELAPQMSFILRSLGHRDGAVPTNADVAQCIDKLSMKSCNALALRIFELHCAISQGLYH